MANEAPGELRGQPFSNKANLPKPLTEGKGPAGLDRKKRTSPKRCHPCGCWPGNFFLEPLIMGSPAACSRKNWRASASREVTGVAARMPATSTSSLRASLPPREASAQCCSTPSPATLRSSRPPRQDVATGREERVLSGEAEALDPSPTFALTQQPGPRQTSTLSGLLRL